MERRRAILCVNLAVLLFGLAGLFAKWVALPALWITFGRVLFSSLTLLVYAGCSGTDLKLRRRRDGAMLALAGAVLALHWWGFLAAIQISTVAIGTITFSSFPLFVTFLEPLVFHRRLRPRDLALALLILLGVMITVPEPSLESGTVRGLAVGMGSALCYAVLTVMNKGFTERYAGVTIAFYEQAVAAVVLLPLLWTAPAQPALRDVGLLLLLGVFTTALAHTLFISSLKAIPAQLAGICSATETVYGILLALLLLGEVPAPRACLGGGVILGVVILAQLLRGREGPVVS